MEQFPAPVYRETVLEVNFEDARDRFLASLLDIHYAHCVMLARRGIISGAEAAIILRALDEIDRDELAASHYDPASEDFFFYLEAKIAERCDPDIAGKLHTARSRNDIDITLYRMEVRSELLRLHAAVEELGRVLLNLAAEHINTVMPAHTHTQPAQPTTLAHYLLGATECFNRDLRRMEAAYATVNRSPLGACAITTTGFPIDRDLTAGLLGFDGLQTNSYGAIAATDYLLESAAALSIAAVNAGKLVHDLLVWAMQEFGFIRLSDAYVQTSSIMPQKRNPVALEHARILLSRAHSEAHAVFACQHNTPFGDIVDSEDDLMPLLFTMFTDAHRAFRLLSGTLQRATFDTELLRARAGSKFLTATELADTLVRLEGLSFREAHHIVAEAVKKDPSDDSHDRIVDDVIAIAARDFSRDLSAQRVQLLLALDPVQFVKSRSIPGGPAARETERQTQLERERLNQSAEWRRASEARLEHARRELARAVRSILT